ncbi:hypothetical protein FQR65_LT17678 [Abscondita terminalis]|nr:hypothetical protein FQR65_LT17678 [Abscondita terminalis]
MAKGQCRKQLPILAYLCRTKNKQARNNNSYRATGGGPPQDDSFTTLEDDILEIIKKVSVEGHDVNEPEVNFDYNCTNNMSVPITFEIEHTEDVVIEGSSGNEINIPTQVEIETLQVDTPSCSSTPTAAEVAKQKEAPFVEQQKKRALTKINTPKKLDN